MSVGKISFDRKELNPHQAREFDDALGVLRHWNPQTQTIADCFQTLQACFSEPTRTLCRKQVRKFTKEALSYLQKTSGKPLDTEESSNKRSSEDPESLPRLRPNSSIWKFRSAFSRFDATTLKTPDDVRTLWENDKAVELRQIVDRFRAEALCANTPEEQIEAEIEAFTHQAQETAYRERDRALAIMSQFAAMDTTPLRGLLGDQNFSVQERLVVLHHQLEGFIPSVTPAQRPSAGESLYLMYRLSSFLPYDRLDVLPLYFEIAKKFVLDKFEVYFVVFNAMGNPLLFSKTESDFLNVWRSIYSASNKMMTDSDTAALQRLHAAMSPFYTQLLDSISQERYLRMVSAFGLYAIVNHILLTLDPFTTTMLKNMNLALFYSLLEWVSPANTGTPRFSKTHTILIPLDQLFLPTTAPSKPTQLDQIGPFLADRITGCVDSLVQHTHTCRRMLPEGCYQVLREKFLSPILVAQVLALLPPPILTHLRTMPESSLRDLLNRGWPAGQTFSTRPLDIAHYITEHLSPLIKPLQPKDQDMDETPPIEKLRIKP